MNHLFLLNETLTNGFNSNLMIINFILSVLCGILVIISKNPVVSVLYLIGLFLNVSSYLMALGLNFIGLSYLLVYVGAVSILFLFILMLINVRISELSSENNNSIPLGIIIVILFSSTLYGLLPNSSSSPRILSNGVVYLNNKILFPWVSHSHEHIVYAFSQNWDGVLAETSHITSIGNILYTGYPILLLLTSLILLLAMVGAIIITIKQ